MDDNREWISLSDLMSGLMLIFLFLVIAFMLKVDAEQQEVEEIATTYASAKSDLKSDLEGEFADNLSKWGAEIMPDATIRFKDTVLLFEPGSSALKPVFRKVLDNFFPRYVQVLKKYDADIKELRIEGHTSSDWTGLNSLNGIYLNNARLSQERSFAVLSHCFYRIKDVPLKNWLIKKLRANGLAFANPILTKNGAEDRVQSKRVEFKAILKTEDKIETIINRIQSKRNKNKDKNKDKGKGKNKDKNNSKDASINKSKGNSSKDNIADKGNNKAPSKVEDSNNNAPIDAPKNKVEDKIETSNK